jgi:hypothetical protein
MARDRSDFPFRALGCAGEMLLHGNRYEIPGVTDFHSSSFRKE